jgi:hypothetical protein
MFVLFKKKFIIQYLIGWKIGFEFFHFLFCDFIILYYFFKKKIDFVVVFNFFSTILSQFHDLSHRFYRLFFYNKVCFLKNMFCLVFFKHSPLQFLFFFLSFCKFVFFFKKNSSFNTWFVEKQVSIFFKFFLDQITRVTSLIDKARITIIFFCYFFLFLSFDVGFSLSLKYACIN